LVLFLEEKNVPPAEYAGQTPHSKEFHPEVRVQDFPIRQHKVELNIKRRRWEVQSSGEIISRNWDLVMKGARLTKEFALFLKDALG
jgi:transposase